jgi:hypothetical protein
MSPLITNLLSGLFGAVLATVLTVVYLYISDKAKLRGEVLLEVVGYCDEIYHLLQTVHTEKDLQPSEESAGLTQDDVNIQAVGVTQLLAGEFVEFTVESV